MNEPVIEEYPDAVDKVKQTIEERIEAETIGVEILDRLMRIVTSRHELREAEEDLKRTVVDMKDAIVGFAAKFDSLAEMKLANLKLERDVLLEVKAEIKKQR